LGALASGRGFFSSIAWHWERAGNFADEEDSHRMHPCARQRVLRSYRQYIPIRQRFGGRNRSGQRPPKPVPRQDLPLFSDLGCAETKRRNPGGLRRKTPIRCFPVAQ
jgi:hypothetical protein